MGRRIERGRRKRKTRKTVFLVTNGAKTENIYLSELRRRIPQSSKLGNEISVKVQVIEGDPLTVFRKITAPKGDSGYDEVWIVVDHDGKNEERKKFLRQCEEKNSKRQQIVGVVSVPCFEVWLIAHYEQVRNYQNQMEARRHYRELSGLPQEKQKHLPNNFPWENLAEACKRSRLSGVELPDLNTQGPCPSTTMPHLIRALGMLRPGAEL